MTGPGRPALAPDSSPGPADSFRDGAGTAPVDRLILRRNPLRLAVSATPWRSAGYLAGYLALGWILASAVLTAAFATALLVITLAGIPLLVVTAAVVRGCASAERWRLRPVITEPVRGSYRRVTRPGIIAQATYRWRDAQTWRDLAYLIGLWVPLTILDTTVLIVWLALLSLVLAPAWYWAPESTFPHGLVVHGIQLGYFPNGPDGAGAVGLYVDSLPKALLAAVAALVLFLLFNYVLAATARAHARAARGLLQAPPDPLAPARAVLAAPGPLGPLTTPAGNGTVPAQRRP